MTEPEPGAWDGPTKAYEEWAGTFRVESIVAGEPDVAGWQAFDLTLRPMDRRGRTNGRTRNLVHLQVGGPVGAVDLTGLRVGRKAEFTYAAGPAPTTRATLHPRRD